MDNFENIDQLVLRGEKACDTGDYLSLHQCVQKLIARVKQQDLSVFVYRQKLIDWTLLLLEWGDFQQRWELRKVLSFLGENMIPQLLKLLADEGHDEELRWFVVRILGELKCPQTIVPLISILQTSPSEDLQTMAATALGEIGQPAIESIAPLLNATSTRLLATRCLSYIRHRHTIDLLLQVVNDEHSQIRAIAIEALASFHDQRVVNVLLDALTDPSAVVRREALIGLGYRSDLCATCNLPDRIYQCLYDLDLEVCCAAAIALGRMGDDTANIHLYHALISPHTPAKLQIEIARGLGRCGQISGLKYLERSLSHCPSITLCREIVSGLGRIAHPHLSTPATKILLNLLQSQHSSLANPEIRSAIALSLGQLGHHEAVEQIIPLLTDNDHSVRFHAIAALKTLAPEIAQQQLQNLQKIAAATDASANLHNSIRSEYQ